MGGTRLSGRGVTGRPSPLLPSGDSGSIRDSSNLLLPCPTWSGVCDVNQETESEALTRKAGKGLSGVLHGAYSEDKERVPRS